MLFDPHSMQFYDILNLKSNFKFKTGYKDIITIYAYVFKVFIELYSWEIISKSIQYTAPLSTLEQSPIRLLKLNIINSGTIGLA